MDDYKQRWRNAEREARKGETLTTKGGRKEQWVEGKEEASKEVWVPD